MRACDRRRPRPTGPAAALRLAGQPAWHLAAAQGQPEQETEAQAPPSRVVPLRPATSAAPARYSVLPAVRPLRSCKGRPVRPAGRTGSTSFLLALRRRLRGRPVAAAPGRRCGALLALALERADGHLAVQLQLELVLDRLRLLAVPLGGQLQVPAQQVVRPVLAQVHRVLAQL